MTLSSDEVTRLIEERVRAKELRERNAVKAEKPEDYSKFDFTKEELDANANDPLWRLSHLYKIIDKKTKVITFKPNAAQAKLIQEMHTCNVILKARKMGFSTFIQLFMLDTAMFSENQNCVVIAQDRDTSEAIFRDVIKFSFNNLPQALRSGDVCTSAATEPSKSSISFKNGSIITVQTSTRGGTPTILHISEFGKIAAKDAAKAREIVTGSITSVPEDGLIFVESTAEGESGEYYEMVQTAIRYKESKKRLGKIDFKFHFFGWWEDPSYVRYDFRDIVITDKDNDYFDDLEKQIGRLIPIERRAWYVGYREARYHGNQDLMYQEMPGTPDEAFKAALEGTYFTEQLRMLRKQDKIGYVPHDPVYPVFTCWDIGANDETAIWMGQAKPGHYAFIDYMDASGEGFNYFVNALMNKGYVYSQHFIPHDANHSRQTALGITTAAEILQSCAPGWQFVLIPRTPDKAATIQQARGFMLQCMFDETKCKEGLRNLALYRKQKNASTGAWTNTPYHGKGAESNTADAFLQAAQANASGALMAMGGFGSFGQAGGFDSGYFDPPPCDF